MARETKNIRVLGGGRHTGENGERTQNRHDALWRERERCGGSSSSKMEEKREKMDGEIKRRQKGKRERERGEERRNEE